MVKVMKVETLKRVQDALMSDRQPFARVPRTDVQRYGADEEPPSFQAGDFILTHGAAWTSKLIRFGQRLRIHGSDRKYTHWNHAAVIVSERGDLIEALGAGVERTRIAKYRPAEYHVICIKATADDRNQAVAFANWAAGGNDRRKRQRYGFLTIVSIAYGLLTGGKFTFGFEGQAICSGLVARSMERTGAIFNRTPTHIMPADLAKYYEVEPPRS